VFLAEAHSADISELFAYYCVINEMETKASESGGSAVSTPEDAEQQLKTLFGEVT
jgi:hypothetical protein